MTTGSELSCVACYLRADHDDLRARLERPVGRLNTLGSGGGPCEVALEPGRRADEQIARVRFAVVGERVSDIARSERELAGAPGEPLAVDLEDELAFEHVERLVEVVHVQGRAGAARADDVLHHRDVATGLLAAQQDVGVKVWYRRHVRLLSRLRRRRRCNQSTSTTRLDATSLHFTRTRAGRKRG